ncbi:DUF397 domain-containing protein [Streptomyces sp. NPDC004610]|uniref:DUF397 domain-containing protein n=1 Tax=unclassified Streptomyces TaxID=2593676 RepID=UPI0033A9FEF3
MSTRLCWTKSSYSGGNDGNDCVEIAARASHIAIRDSKTPTRATLRIGPAAFAPFLQALKNGTSDA